MGRQSITWSHPGCCISNLIVAVESTGRGKCKCSGERLPKGAPKLGVRSHSATSWVQLHCAPQLLAPVLCIGGEAHRAATEAALGTGQDNADPSIEGFDSLPLRDMDTVRAALRQVTVAATAATAATAGGDTGSASRGDSALAPDQAGGNLTGRVAWKFGGHVCYGELLPRQETAAHCFARTHKGNTKTLAKGKTYWWRV